jgi:NADH-quinone oxidoreductase subunit H
MQEFIDQTIIQGWLGQDAATWAGTHWLYAALMLLVGLVAAVFGAVYSGICTWLERRWAGRIQSRVGPNRVGPLGFFQWIADAIKLILKEDTIPNGGGPPPVPDGAVLRLRRLPAHLRGAALEPEARRQRPQRRHLLRAGHHRPHRGRHPHVRWASNSKWALFGGIRAAAQVVSYEIPAGMTLLIPVLMAGTLSVNGIIAAQGGPQDGSLVEVGGWPWNWFVFANPMAFAGFFIFLTASLAEGNRTPFDLPEAESELVSGYNTEYSGIRFAVFFLVEFGNLYVMSALVTILFLGGWQIPGVRVHEITDWYHHLACALIFLGKVFVLTNVIMWLRWTLPRIRVDQMMSLCWKYLVPVSMGLVVLTAASEWLLSGLDPRILLAVHLAFFVLAGVVPLFLFVKQVFRNIRLVGDRVDLTNW